MSRNTDALETIREAPEGPGVAAFFDLDNTLLCGWSVVPLLRDLVLTKVIMPAWRPWSIEPLRLAAAVARHEGPRSESESFELALQLMARALRGRREPWLSALCRRIYSNELANLVYPEMRELVALHRERGHYVVMATAATLHQVNPVAEDLRFASVLSSSLEVQKGRFSGRLAGPACCGDGKRMHAVFFAEEHGIDLDRSFFYSDGIEDLPLLEAVGRPVATNPGERLRKHAEEQGWPVLDCTPRGGPSLARFEIDLRSALRSWL